MCHLAVEEAFSVAFEETMRWCACMVMKAGYGVLGHAWVRSVQRIMPRRRCA